MSVQKLQATRALPVIPSDSAEIPYPFVICSGTSTTVQPNVLRDSSASFITNNVAVGDVVYNTTTNTSATVVSIISPIAINLNADIFLSLGDSYIIYNNSNQTGFPNAGCTLYIGETGDVNVRTIGNDIIVFYGVQGGTILPVQVKQVYKASTNAGLINALW